MSISLHAIITIISLASLLHCAYSAAQHRSYLRLTEQPFVSLPADVICQTLISLIALIYGASYVAAPFQQIKSDPNMGRGGQLSFFRHFQPSWSSHVSLLQTTSRPGVNHLSRSLLKPQLSFINIRPFHFSSVVNYSQNPDFSHLPGARLPKSNVRSRVRPLEFNKEQALDSFKHCTELIRRNDVDNYLSILTFPKKIQPELIALYSLNVELALIRDKVNARGNNDTSGMYRLQFWKDSLSAIYGEANVPIPRQPVAIGLCAFAPEANPAHLETLVTARQQTLGDKPFATVFELCGYGARTTGSLLQLTAESLMRFHNEDVNMDNISRAASDIGGAFAVLNLIRSTLPLLTRGVVLLPSDLLSLNNLTPDRVYRKTHLDDCKHVVKDMVRISEKHLASGRERVSSLPSSIRPAFIATTASADHILKMIKKADYDVYNSVIQKRNALLLWLILYRKLFGKC